MRYWRWLARGGRLLLHILAGLALGFLLILPALYWQRRDSAWRDRWVLWWFQGLLKLLHVRLRVIGVPPAAPTLVVANHISWLDIVLLGGILPASFVAKAEIARWPLINGLCRVADTRYIERGNMESTQRNIAAIAATLRSGRNVAVFPEGTSTDGKQVKPFRRRLFQAALDSNTPVQAVALRYPSPQGNNPAVAYIGEMSFGQSLLAVLAQPEIVAEAHFLPLLPSPSDSAALARQAWQQVEQAVLPRRDSAGLEQYG
jgi:1-acyl-sn-glycerol-3-phosphate acyltransferase